MSTNYWNEFRPGFMRNFSDYVIERYIIIDDDTMTDNEKDKFVLSINEELWRVIQETNILAEGRILPFVRVRRVVDINDELRIIVNDIDSCSSFDDYENECKEKINIDQLSHLINFKTLSPRKQIQVSDRLIPGNAKMIISRADQISAAVDIFLDIAMFNSYSFLHSLKIEQKREFNDYKFKFAKEHSLESYYQTSTNEPPAYWSMAFSARINNKSIDFYKYVRLWEIFIKSTPYSSNENMVIPPYEQLKSYRHISNLPNECFTKSFWEEFDKGDKLFIRINREPNDNEKKLMLTNLFGIPKFRVGAVNVLDIKDYYIHYIYQLMEELYISAFKVVV